MAVRNIIRIDEEKCNGCGDCVSACAEGAIQMVNGKAKLVSEVYCDGLGACLGDCPTGAITIETREAADYDQNAVDQHLARQKMKLHMQAFPMHHGGGCPGSRVQTVNGAAAATSDSKGTAAVSQLRQWPVQLHLVPPFAPYLQNADLVICADCVPFAVPDFHNRYLAGRAVLVGCPKLDDLGAYYEKLQQIYQHAQPKRVTVLRMEVPCCGGIAQAAVQAAEQVEFTAPFEIHTIGINGSIHVETLSTGRQTAASGE